ncbi:MAG: RNA methyltransferase [Oligoflexia bacterium]|nr:RNA methyltransferase [Oligoflexia bacterium]
MNIPDYDIFVCLVHYPIKDKNGEIVTTAVTNFDIHDIARLTRTFGFKGYAIVTPVVEQQALVQRIVDHWTTGPGFKRNDNRTFAMQAITIKAAIGDVIDYVKEKTGKDVRLVATSAKKREKSASISDFAKVLDDGYSYLVLFGTGWGLTDETIAGSDYLLEPLSYNTDYNHLPVRSAVSIIMDRLYNELGRL